MVGSEAVVGVTQVGPQPHVSGPAAVPPLQSIRRLLQEPQSLPGDRAPRPSPCVPNGVTMLVCQRVCGVCMPVLAKLYTCIDVYACLHVYVHMHDVHPAEHLGVEHCSDCAKCFRSFSEGDAQSRWRRLHTVAVTGKQVVSGRQLPQQASTGEAGAMAGTRPRTSAAVPQGIPPAAARAAG